MVAETCFYHYFGGVLQPGPSPAPHARPDPSTLCHGFHRPTVTYGTASGGSQTLDVRALVESEPGEHAVWRPDRYFTGRIPVSQGRGTEPAVTTVDGTVRAVDCTRFCIDAEGRTLPDGMCDACRRLPKQHSFRELLRRRTVAARRVDRDDARVRFDLLTPARRLELLRAFARKTNELKRSVWLLRQNYLRKAARVRKLMERLDETTVRGDTKALISDIISIEKAGKFKQRATLFHFLKDLVHSLKLRDEDRGRHSSDIRWHESSKRIFAVLLKQGGPKTWCAIMTHAHEHEHAHAGGCASSVGWVYHLSWLQLSRSCRVPM